jgi:FkbM family methyltransferase
MWTSLKKKSRMLARSRSPSFVRDALASYDPQHHSIEWQGMTLWYRPGSSDTWMIYDHLMSPPEHDEYAPPAEFTLPAADVHMVLDIGANVGVTALYLSRIFPNARIHAFEPAPDNFAVLAKNAAACARIHAHNFALGAQDATLDLYSSDNPINFGGYSLHPTGSDTSKKTSIPVRQVSAVLDELGVTGVDVIKVDTEGAEWDILTAIPERILAGTKYITGELHGNRDFALLDYLSRWFDLGVRKSISSRLFNFQAISKEASLPPRGK